MPPTADTATIQTIQTAADPDSTAGILQALAGLPYIELGILFVLYFIGGYLLYASFFAAAGASVSQQEDASQFTMPFIMHLAISNTLRFLYSNTLLIAEFGELC